MSSKFLFFLLPSIAAAGGQSPFLNIFFEPNLGQSRAPVQYIARAPGAALSFEAGGVRIDTGARPVLLRFAGASRSARFEPLDATPDRTFYIQGSDPSRWTRDVPHYRRLALRRPFPGIDVVFYGSGGRLEYDLVVAPGADVSRVKLRFEGADLLSPTGSGGLKIRAGDAEFEMQRPRVYQRAVSGVEEAIESDYVVTAKNEVRFSIGAYDRGRELVVDPVLQFSTYFGGERDDSVVGVTAVGDVVGVTSSSSFGTGTLRRSKDIFALVSMQSYGQSFYFIGGSGDDVPTSAVATSDGVLIGGWTRPRTSWTV